MRSAVIPQVCGACGADRPLVGGGLQAGPDPCLGMLPGVRFACCGHGKQQQCYVVLEIGNSQQGKRAFRKLIALGGNPAPFDTANTGWIDKPLGFEQLTIEEE